MSGMMTTPVHKLEELRHFTTEPMLIARHTENTSNHILAYLNAAFTEVLGWEMHDIPDKNTWWQLAYPDPGYRKAVEQQWELLFQDAIDSCESSIVLDVNIMTKHRGLRRFSVRAEIESKILADHYVVLFSSIGTNAQPI
jgi:PAS domain-containing protein